MTSLKGKFIALIIDYREKIVHLSNHRQKILSCLTDFVRSVKIPPLPLFLTDSIKLDGIPTQLR